MARPYQGVTDDPCFRLELESGHPSKWQPNSHLIPFNDARTHEASPRCWCQPVPVGKPRRYGGTSQLLGYRYQHVFSGRLSEPADQRWLP